MVGIRNSALFEENAHPVVRLDTFCKEFKVKTFSPFNTTIGSFVQSSYASILTSCRVLSIIFRTRLRMAPITIVTASMYTGTTKAAPIHTRSKTTNGNNGRVECREREKREC